MQSCRLFSAKLKFLAGFATKNQLACMSAVPEPIRKPDVKFSKVNYGVFVPGCFTLLPIVGMADRM